MRRFKTGRESIVPPAPAHAGAPGATVVWFTGLPSAGKTTVATLVARELERCGRHVEHLDGDLIRADASPSVGFGEGDRKAHLARVAASATELARAGAIVLVSTISPYAETRRAARDAISTVGTFVEVHVATPLEVCVRRDTKGLYARALAGEIDQFTGISAPYEEPIDPELRLDTSFEAPDESAARVLAYLARP